MIMVSSDRKFKSGLQGQEREPVTGRLSVMVLSSSQLLFLRAAPTSPGRSGPKPIATDPCALRAVVVIRGTVSARQQRFYCVLTGDDSTDLCRISKAAGADMFVFTNCAKIYFQLSLLALLTQLPP
jgi:hypothetical protein